MIVVVWFKWLSGSARCLGLCVLAACGQHANLDPDENEIKRAPLTYQQRRTAPLQQPARYLKRGDSEGMEEKAGEHNGAR